MSESWADLVTSLEDEYQVDVFWDGHDLRYRTRGRRLSDEDKRGLSEKLSSRKQEIISGLDTQLKIVALGSLEIGTELELSERVSRSDGLMTGQVYVPQLPLGGRPFERALDGWGSGSAPMPQLAVERILQEVRPTRKLEISDAGLVAGYCILGAPGVGKTRLYKSLLKKVISYRKDQKELRYGCLVFDQKAGEVTAAIEDAAREAGRTDDLLILDPNKMQLGHGGSGPVNVLSCGIDPIELGKQLALVGLGLGGQSSDPYWFGAWSNLFFGAVLLLTWDEERALTVPMLLESLDRETSNEAEPKILSLARKWEREKDRETAIRDLDELRLNRSDLDLAARRVFNFYASQYKKERSDDKTAVTVYNLVMTSLGRFGYAKDACFSENKLKSQEVEDLKNSRTIYDQIINDGRIVVLSMNPEELHSQTAIYTLVKCIFQQKLQGRRSRAERARAQRPGAAVRPDQIRHHRPQPASHLRARLAAPASGPTGRAGAAVGA